MTDLRLDTDHDLYWANGELDTVEGSDEILQAAWIVLNTGLGEWDFDTSFGFPHRQLTEQRGYDPVALEGAVRACLEPILGDGAIIAIEVIHDAATKTVTISVDSIYGEIEAEI